MIAQLMIPSGFARFCVALVLVGVPTCLAAQAGREWTVTDSAGIRVVTSVRAQGLEWAVSSAPELSIGVTAGDEHLQLHRARSALILSDGRVVVANSGTSQVRLYSHEGEFLSAFGHPGQGPGEFHPNSLMRVFAIGDELVVSDEANGRINIYGTDGEFRRTVSLRIDGYGNIALRGVTSAGHFLGYAPVGTGIMSNRSGERIEMKMAFLLLSPAGQLQEVIEVFPSRPRIVHSTGQMLFHPYLPLTVDPAAAVSQDRILLTAGMDASASSYGANGRKEALYRWSVPRFRSSEVWPRYQAEALQAIENSEQRRMYRSFYESRPPIPELLPAIDALIIDEPGYVWARRFAPFWEKAAVWDILSREGQWLTSVTLPAGLEILDVHESMLLGRRTNDLGVEQIVIHRLSRRLSDS